MTKTSLLSSCEITINTILKRLSKLEGKDKKALETEFSEWIHSIESDNKNYDVLYMNKINLS